MTVTKFIFHQNQSRTPTNDSLLYLKIKKEEVEGNNSVLYDVTNVDDNIFETTDHHEDTQDPPISQVGGTAVRAWRLPQSQHCIYKQL